MSQDRSLLRALLATLLVLAPAPVFADPEIVVDSRVIAGGLVQYELGVTFDDGLAIAAAFDAIFSGASVQNQSMGVDVNRDDDAALLDGIFGYSAARDSYFFMSEWANVFPGPGPDGTSIVGGEPGSPIYLAQAGSGGGSAVTDFARIAQLVLPATETFAYDVIIARDQQDYRIIPEPGAASGALAAIATLGALVRARRNPLR